MNEFAEAAAMMPDPYRLLWKKEVRSTNDELRNLAEDGMAGGLVLLAESQTSGRGRRGATWFSPAGEGLAFSILLRPEAPKPFWSRLSLVAGLAVAEALERSIPMAEIKWPNDVMVADKKIAGILVEAENDFVIVGIGINVNTTSFPNELPATSLALEKGGQVERSKVLLDVIERLSLHAERLGTEFEETMLSIRRRCWLTGKQVNFISGGVPKAGLVNGLGSGGELLLKTGAGLEAIVQADEVRVRA